MNRSMELLSARFVPSVSVKLSISTPTGAVITAADRLVLIQTNALPRMVGVKLEMN